MKLDPMALAIEAYRRLRVQPEQALRLGLPLLILSVAWEIFVGGSAMPVDATTPPSPDMSPEQLAAIRQAAFDAIAAGIAYAIPFVLLYGVLIANMTRLFLVGPQATFPSLGLGGGAPLRAVVWRFVQAVLMMVVIGIVVTLPLSLLLGLFSMTGGPGLGLGLLAAMAAGLVLFTIGLRLSIAAYATAAGTPMTIMQAWRLTQGNSVALLACHLAVNLPVMAAILIVWFGLGALTAVVPYSVTLVVSLVALVASLASVAVMVLATEKLLDKSGAPAPVKP